MTQMYEAAEAILPEKTTEEWLRILKEAHVPAIHANEIGEVLEDPHLNASGLFQKREHPTEGSYIEVRQPVRFSGFDYPESTHAPARTRARELMRGSLDPIRAVNCPTAMPA